MRHDRKSRRSRDVQRLLNDSELRKPVRFADGTEREPLTRAVAAKIVRLRDAHLLGEVPAVRKRLSAIARGVARAPGSGGRRVMALPRWRGWLLEGDPSAAPGMGAPSLERVARLVRHTASDVRKLCASADADRRVLGLLQWFDRLLLDLHVAPEKAPKSARTAFALELDSQLADWRPGLSEHDRAWITVWAGMLLGVEDGDTSMTKARAAQRQEQRRKRHKRAARRGQTRDRK